MYTYYYTVNMAVDGGKSWRNVAVLDRKWKKKNSAVYRRGSGETISKTQIAVTSLFNVYIDIKY